MRGLSEPPSSVGLVRLVSASPSEIISRLPWRALLSLALPLPLRFRQRLSVLFLLPARPLPLTHRTATFVLKSPPLPRRLGCLVLWLFFVYVHHCKFVVCLAAIVRLARFGWLLARSWLCCAVGQHFVVAPRAAAAACLAVVGCSLVSPPLCPRSSSNRSRSMNLSAATWFLHLALLRGPRRLPWLLWLPSLSPP